MFTKKYNVIYTFSDLIGLKNAFNLKKTCYFFYFLFYYQILFYKIIISNNILILIEKNNSETRAVITLVNMAKNKN
tara:strand:- start:101 stop:328 length:228 start_codon:yes stop_codon:yes gene_type:complete